jgi:hypothetical protein
MDSIHLELIGLKKDSADNQINIGKAIGRGVI